MKKEQEYLFIKAERSLNAAQELKSKYPDFAISRAYYSMFYLAEALLLEQNLSFSSHAGVISAIGKYLAKTNKIPTKYHRYLIDAQDQRNKSDYDINPSLTEEDATKLIIKAEEMLNFVRGYLK